MANLSKTMGYKCEFFDKVPEDYFCKQCKHVAKEPNTTSCCRKCFCESCIKNNDACPFCKQDGFKATRNPAFEDKIQALIVHCTMKDHGCKWTGQLQYLDTHFTNECLVDRVKCDRCTENVPEYNLNTHLANECPEREFSCKYCSFKATYKIVSEQHLNICTYFILNCSNRCGATFERGDLEDHMKMCSQQEVKCEFSYAGCETEFIRDQQKDHMEQNTQKHLVLIAAALRYQQQILLNLRNEETQESYLDEQHIRDDDQNAQRQHAPGIKIQHKYDECENTERETSEQVEQIHEEQEERIQHQLHVVVNPQELRNRSYSIAKVLTLIAPILLAILLGFHFQSLSNTDEVTNTLEGREGIGQEDKLNHFGLEIEELKKLVEQLKPLQKAPEQEVESPGLKARLGNCNSQ